MIILDVQQVLIANIFAPNNAEVGRSPELFRHMALNTIRAINFKNRDEYGELVIACDGGNYWRRQRFPYYKFKRRESQANSPVDWEGIHAVMRKLRADLRDYFPYRVIELEGAEADDVIGSLCEEHGRDFGGEPILIVSGDKDFAQLQRHANVRQYDPVRKKKVEVPDARAYLLEHIMKGDSGDGIPNVLSDDDTFVTPGKRSKPLTEKQRSILLKDHSHVQANWDRNETLIDLSYIPLRIKDLVLYEYDRQAGKDRSKVLDYMIANGLKHLTGCLNEF